MKNLILAFAFLIASTFASCSYSGASNETPAVDSTEVDTVAVDSLVTEADSLTVNSVL